MNRFIKMVSLLLAMCLLLGSVPFAFAEDEVIDADLTCTITLATGRRIPPLTPRRPFLRATRPPWPSSTPMSPWCRIITPTA